MELLSLETKSSNCAGFALAWSDSSRQDKEALFTIITHLGSELPVCSENHTKVKMGKGL